MCTGESVITNIIVNINDIGYLKIILIFVFTKLKT